ncbi:hypothetical protein ACHAW5_002249 [Stephanodiscus triporus]|uniref:SUI1 domain-containing protein n=1 Tax=Stephanodiscus triporus TaxID=2934178 RepID=A0ABD3PEC6_9STRA
MFHKSGSSTIGGKKDVPLRKSDRRRLRDRVLAEALFVGVTAGDVVPPSRGQDEGGGGGGTTTTTTTTTTIRLVVDDAILSGGEILSRKLRLSSSSGGGCATLFLRTPSCEGGGSSGTDVGASSSSSSWPYRRTVQPILLEHEDGDRKVRLIPLVPLLAALPPRDDDDDDDDDDANHRIPPNVVVHPEVSKYLCRGADLMRSGMRSFPPPWALRRSGGIVTVSVIGNPQPMAVGTVEPGLFRDYCYSKKSANRGGAAGDGGVVDWRTEAKNFVGPGKKGVGVIIVNCYGDDLWRGSLPPKAGSFGCVNGSPPTVGDVINPLGGGAYDDGNYGNDGFVEGKVVVPIMDVGGGSDKDSDEDGDEDAAAEMVGRLDVSDPAGKGSAAAFDDAPTDAADDDDLDGQESDLREGSNEGGETEVDHNKILSDACYASLLLLLSSKTTLPMPVSTFYAKHLLPAIPTTGPRLDMKRTSYKKIGPFLKEMESNGVIKLGASKDGKDRCAFLSDIAKDNPMLIRFKKNWKKEIEASGGDLSAMKSPPASQGTKLAVVDLFIVPHNVSKALQLDMGAVMAANAKTDERKGTGFLTKTECRALIEDYIEKEGLVVDRSGRVLVNGPLCDEVFRRSKKTKIPGQSTDCPNDVERKDLIEKWIERMDKGHALVQMPGSKILHLGRGPPTPVNIEVEFRQGNRKKFLTRIRGMEEYGVDGESLSQDISHRFACSSTIETNPVGRPALKKGRVELVLQGHLSEELNALLSGDETLTSHGGVKGGEYNLPKSVINIVLRKGVPARKKR